MEIQGAGDVDVDDSVTGDFETLGGMTVRNETRKTDLSVFVQDFHCSAEVVLQTYRLRCPPPSSSR
jgi:hypothetical protein